MKRNGILNLGLNQALAAMGHGDFMIVCDAGFPIPAQVSRVDLAIVADVPDIETVGNFSARANPQRAGGQSKIYHPDWGIRSVG